MRGNVSTLFTAALLLTTNSLGTLRVNHEIRVDTVASGVKLSLVLPKAQYPRNALVKATVRLKNVSDQPIPFPGTCPPGGVYVEVINKSGRVDFPPPLLSLLPSSCPPPTPAASRATLSPGQSVQRTVFVILRAAQIRAVTETSARPGPVQGHVLTVQLGAGSAPNVKLRMEPSVEALVKAGKGQVRAPLHYDAWATCADTSGPLPSYPGSETGWKTIRARKSGTYVLRPEVGSATCSRVLQWHFVAGFLNHPVACFDFVRNPLPPNVPDGIKRACEVSTLGK